MPIVLGGIEGSLRRIAHYDYWSDKVRRSIVVDSKCDILLYGNAERALVELAHRLAAKEPIASITDLRGTAFLRRETPEAWYEINSTEVDTPGRTEAQVNPYLMASEQALAQGEVCELEAMSTKANDKVKGNAANVNPNSSLGAKAQPLVFMPGVAQSKPLPQAHSAIESNRSESVDLSAQSAYNAKMRGLGNFKVPPRERSVIRLPSFEQVQSDPVLYAHANRVLHLETNPGNARALVQQHGQGVSAKDVWINPPPIPLTTAEMDFVFGLPYARSPHPAYQDANGRHDGDTKIPAWEMIRFSVNIMRGCFGGCTFCSITEHEGRIIQSRSEDSIIQEIEDIKDKVQGFTGVISDLGGPTANMYRIGCKSLEIESACRKPSCVYPGICSNLNTEHGPLIKLYRRARAIPGVKKILIGSGLRYDLAVKSPEYVKELTTHHVGGYLKIAPEHTETGPLSKMMKPGMGAYDQFKQMFDRFSAEAGKKQYLVPYFIAAHPGTQDEDMMRLAIWLKKNGFRADQVQTFYPSPMASATAMYHSRKNPLKKVTHQSEEVQVVKGERQRRLHKAFLRYHDPKNWPLLRDALKAMGRADLIGNGKHHLIPTFQPLGETTYVSARKKNSSSASGNTSRALNAGSSIKGQVSSAPKPGKILTQHTGLPPRAQGRLKPNPTKKR
jgi:uncharacterized radical SAM protein YgiQ